MPYTSDPYTKTVCACLRYATAKEKAAVQAELEAHIEDHTEALLAAGYNAGHAQRLAVEAMGDPQDVGQALNEAFPRRWWVLSRLAAFALVASVALLVLYLPAPIGHVQDYCQAKYDPMSFDWHLDSLPELTPLDFQYDLPGGSTLSLYAVGLAEGEAGAYTAYLCAVDYSGSPFQSIDHPAQRLSFTWEAEDPYAYIPMGEGCGCRYFALYQLQELPFSAHPVAHFDYNGTRFDVEIPLPWEEVSP